MRNANRSRAAVLIAVGLIVGYFIGPPIASAVGSLVTIKGAGTNSKARVTRTGSLKVDTEACVTGGYMCAFAFTQADGASIIARGTATRNNAVPKNRLVLASVVLDVSSSASVPVQVIIRDAAGRLLWVGTAAPGGHLNDQFDGGIFATGPADVTVTGTGANYLLYGESWNAGAAPAAAGNFHGSDSSA